MNAKHIHLIKALIVLFLLIHIDASALNWSEIDTNKIQKKSRFIRKKFTKYPTVLAAKLTKDMDDDASKVIAITYWIAKNIKYDYQAYLSNTLDRKNSREVLKSRKALCGEYAMLFNDMCESVGVKSQTISGYVHNFDFFAGDTLYRAEHAWSTVFVDDHWELMDLTFGAGHIAPKKQWLKNNDPKIKRNLL